jgi:hypothetical protein
VWIGPNTPTDSATELWVDTDDKALYAKISGSWTKVTADQAVVPSEVEIAPGDPIATNAAVELWFDSDDEPLAADNANYWNSAWGLVARGTFTGSTVMVPVTVLCNMTATTVVGRRYRITLYIRAISSASVGTAFMELRKNNVAIGGPWIINPNGSYGSSTTSFLMDGDGTTSAFGYVCVQGGGGQLTFSVDQDSSFTIEDIGPITRAAVNPPAGQPQVAAAGNALGIVAMGSFLASSFLIPAGALTVVTSSISYTMLAGRRYRVTFAVRAAQSHTAAVTTFKPWLRDGSTALHAQPPIFPVAAYAGPSYQPIQYAWTFDGDGVARSFNVALQPGPESSVDAYTDYLAFFYIEDVGPNQAPALPIPDTPPGWTPLPFAATWTNLSPAYSQCAYRKIGDRVELRGIAVSSSTANTIATLPVGFRPSGISMYPVLSMDVAVRLDVQTSGALVRSAGGSVVNGSWVGLDGITFSVTP